MGNAEKALPGRAVAAAAAAAAVGAGIWSLVAVLFHYEHAAIAWAIGAAVGGLFHKLGGRGGAGALLCIGLTAGAIVAGKYMAVQRILDQQRQAVHDVFGGPEAYAAMKAAADAFRKNAEENREFLADEGDEEGFEEDGDEDVFAAAEGETEEIPEFPDTFEGFQAELQKSMDVDGMGLVLESLTLIDALFFGLAILTAWQLAMGKGARLVGAPAYRTRPRGEPPEAP